MTINLKYLTIGLISLFVIFALDLFLAAGTIFWAAGWAFLVLFFGANGALALWLLKHDPGLLQERMTAGWGKTGEAAEPLWDKIFMAGLEVFLLAWMAVMGLDAVRYRWSQMPGWLQVAGAILMLGSFSLFFLTFRENPFASPAIRIQTERGQKVITTGPYQYVRHPMYAAGIPFAVGTALLLGSWLGVLLGLLFSAALAWRAVQEERVLAAALPGYAEYMARVKYRFLPRVW